MIAFNPTRSTVGGDHGGGQGFKLDHGSKSANQAFIDSCHPLGAAEVNGDGEKISDTVTELVY